MKRANLPGVCRAALAAAICVALSGCYMLGTGRITVRPEGTKPTVRDMVDHIACVIGAAYANGTSKNSSYPTQQMWERLYENNFVADANLTLMVTDNEGFNPSYSAITPLNGAGAKLNDLVFSNASTGGTGGSTSSNSYNRTLAVGLQLSSAQDRSVVQDYMIDLHVLIDAYNKNERESNTIEDDKATNKFPNCGRPDPKAIALADLAAPAAGAIDPNTSQFSFADKVTSPLQGNLHLTEIIEDGLTAIEESRLYNLYGTSGPAGTTNGGQPTTDSTKERPTSRMPVSPQNEVYTLAQPEPNAATSSSQTFSDVGAAAGGAKATFSSKIDFYITEGVNGGPSLVTLTKKAGAGSGGSGQPLNASRMTQDSLTITFGATCYAPQKETIELNSFEPLPDSPMAKIIGTVTSVENGCGGYRFEDHGGTLANCEKHGKELSRSQCGELKTPERKCDAWSFQFEAPIPPPVDQSSHDSYPKMLDLASATSEVRITPISLEDYPDGRDPDLPGKIAWTGFQTKDKFFLRGIVTSEMTAGAVVGQIWLQSDPKQTRYSKPSAQDERRSKPSAQDKSPRISITSFPVYIDGALNGIGDQKDYWYSIPNCDAITSGQRQQAAENTKSQNQTQRLVPSRP